LKNNRNFISAVVKINGLLLEYASDELKNNYLIVYIAVKNNGLAL
jgi:hypothetical protein